MTKEIKIVSEDSVPVASETSPKGAYSLERRHMSVALGGIRDVGLWGGGHPFDVERAALPPGKKNYPLHAHAAQWEHYIFLSGSGQLIGAAGERRAVRAGDHAVCPPGTAHQLENDGEVPLVYYLIADHHVADVVTYPDTGKRLLVPEFKLVRYKEVDYYEGEE
ncbi:cupin domain-containing protein [Coraliomargarita parva]|uniref:cupin domain-containing protein n=1 Tax=Coraliomargarita parva TaxID=3014050 RepID=UPI0022B5DA03|nr:cupin domain-containing protein [Coraliomargarita parva]